MVTIISPQFIKLVTSAAGSIHYNVTYVGISSTDTAEPYTAVGIITTAATTSIVTTGGSGVTRKISSVKIYNNGITNTITLKLDNSGTDIILAVFTLGNGESWQDGNIYNSDGYLKQEMTVNQSPIDLEDIGQSGATDGQLASWNNGTSHWVPITVATLSEAGVGALISGSGDAVPNDTDHVATSNGTLLKKITWTNVKAHLKTYFDTLYQATGLAALKANNLSDLANAGTARGNLGLGTLATQSGTFSAK